MLKFLFVISLIFLTGCASHNIQNYGEVDLNQKTITVPPGSNGLKGELKKALYEDGWKMVVYGGPEITEGSFGKSTNLKKYSTFSTRYTLSVASKQYDICLNFQPAINYDVSLIDNKTGSEILTLDGSGCEGAVIEQFKRALNLSPHTES